MNKVLGQEPNAGRGDSDGQGDAEPLELRGSLDREGAAVHDLKVVKKEGDGRNGVRGRSVPCPFHNGIVIVEALDDSDIDVDEPPLVHCEFMEEGGWYKEVGEAACKGGQVLYHIAVPYHGRNDAGLVGPPHKVGHARHDAVPLGPSGMSDILRPKVDEGATVLCGRDARINDGGDDRPHCYRIGRIV